MRPPSVAVCLLVFRPSDFLALDEMCCNQARREWPAKEKFGKEQHPTVCSHQILFHHTCWFLARAVLCGVFAWVSSVHSSFACTFGELETDVPSYKSCSFQLTELLHRSGSPKIFLRHIMTRVSEAFLLIHELSSCLGSCGHHALWLRDSAVQVSDERQQLLWEWLTATDHVTVQGLNPHAVH